MWRQRFKMDDDSGVIMLGCALQVLGVLIVAVSLYVIVSAVLS